MPTPSANELLRMLGVSSDPRFVAPTAGAKPGVDADGRTVWSENPATGEIIGGWKLDDAAACERVIAESVETFRKWREVPAPKRGLVVRAIGDELRRLREPLGELVSLEMGKVRAEGIGEVQESVDIADYAVGLSRMLPGSVFPSERAGVRMFEQWLPLGPIGCITAFNFPNAVWAWNAMLAAVCGDVTIWKPSLLTPLISAATSALAERVSASMGHGYGGAGVFRLVIGTDEAVGSKIVDDKRIPLISATGSTRMGRIVGERVARRLGRTLLELGGNNAVIVHEDADQEIALRSCVFGAVGTAGQRCTTTRRLFVHEKIAESFTARLVAAYRQVATKIGDPLKEGTLVGPLINAAAVEGFENAIRQAKEQGAEVLFGGTRAAPPGLNGHFVTPTIIRAPKGTADMAKFPIACHETFAPIVYVFTYRTLDGEGGAIAMQNGVDQGLASAIFTEGLRSAERFLAPSGAGSDCGLAYVNLGTSGAEIGGAFGGEKDTGGGRESGSDSWKAYMRRQSVSVNFSGTVELAQGIRFE